MSILSPIHRYETHVREDLGPRGLSNSLDLPRSVPPSPPRMDVIHCEDTSTAIVLESQLIAAHTEKTQLRPMRSYPLVRLTRGASREQRFRVLQQWEDAISTM